MISGQLCLAGQLEAAVARKSTKQKAVATASPTRLLPPETAVRLRMLPTLGLVADSPPACCQHRQAMRNLLPASTGRIALS